MIAVDRRCFHRARANEGFDSSYPHDREKGETVTDYLLLYMGDGKMPEPAVEKPGPVVSYNTKTVPVPASFAEAVGPRSPARQENGHPNVFFGWRGEP